MKNNTKMERKTPCEWRMHRCRLRSSHRSSASSSSLSLDKSTANFQFLFSIETALKRNDSTWRLQCKFHIHMHTFSFLHLCCSLPFGFRLLFLHFICTSICHFHFSNETISNHHIHYFSIIMDIFFLFSLAVYWVRCQKWRIIQQSDMNRYLCPSIVSH